MTPEEAGRLKKGDEFYHVEQSCGGIYIARRRVFESLTPRGIADSWGWSVCLLDDCFLTKKEALLEANKEMREAITRFEIQIEKNKAEINSL